MPAILVQSVFDTVFINPDIWYVWIYENRANVNTTSLRLFQKTTQAFFTKSSTGSLSTLSLLTNLACVWLVGVWPLSLQEIGWPELSCNENQCFTDENACVCDPPPPPSPQELEPGTPAWYQLVARQ